MLPLVSVIMPVYNAEKYLCEAIESVINQTYANWELLITNDGSTDNSKNILQSYTDKRIKIIHQENKGVSAARNRGLDMMIGNYFTFLDADDRLSSNSLETRISFAEQHPDADMIAGPVVFFNDLGPQKTWYPDYRGNPFPLFIRNDERVFCNPALLIRRKESVVYKFKEAMTYVEDLLFFASISQQQRHNYDYVSEIVYQYRITGDSAMKNLKLLEKGYWSFYDEVKKMPDITYDQKRYLKWRILRIMALSYLGSKEFSSLLKLPGKVFK